MKTESGGNMRDYKEFSEVRKVYYEAYQSLKRR